MKRTGSQTSTEDNRACRIRHEIQDAMTIVWKRMGELFGASFVRQFGNVGGPAFTTWCLGLNDLSFNHIEKGFKRFLSQDRSMPGNYKDFRKCCFPSLEELGLPEPDNAYKEACDHSDYPDTAKWSNLAVRMAAKQTGYFELRNESESVIKHKFINNYKYIVYRIMKGDNITDIQDCLPKPGEVSLADQSKNYHDTYQQENIKKSGFDNLTNPNDALLKIKDLINGNK